MIYDELWYPLVGIFLVLTAPVELAFGRASPNLFVLSPEALPHLLQ